MGDILIHGMEMPTGSAERCIVIRGDGTIRTFTGALIDYATAISVPPHGDLISRETAKLYHSYLVDERTDIRVPAIPLSVLNVIPTIIPAEEGE